MLETMDSSTSIDGNEARAIHGRADRSDLARDGSGQRGRGGQAPWGEPTYHLCWRKKFGQLDTDEVKRLKGLERENARLRKLLVDRVLEIEVMREINAKKW